MPLKCVKMTKEDHKLQKEKIQSYSKILKETLSEGETKYDEKYAEDGTQISKHRNFKVLAIATLIWFIATIIGNTYWMDLLKGKALF